MRSAKGWVTLFAAVTGFILPFFWLFVAFATFTAPQSPAADRFWRLVNLSCPSWDLMGSPLGLILSPLINSAMYGFVMWCFVSFLEFLGMRFRAAKCS